MRYVVTHGSDEIVVEVEPRDDGRFDVEVGGRRILADLRTAGGRSRFSVLLDEESYEAAVVRAEHHSRVTLRGQELSFTVESEQERNARLVEAAGKPHGPHSVKSVMPGRVARIFVRPGEEVDAGTALLIVEAMKMENEIRSAAAGRVVDVLVDEGQTVGNGEALVTIE